MRRIFAALGIVAVVSTILVSPSSAIDSNQELLNKYLWPPVSPLQGDPMNYPLLGYHVGIVDNFVQGNGGMSMSRIEAITHNSNSSKGYPCESFADANCQKLVADGATWGGNIVLPPCKSVDEVNFCIESLQIADGQGTRSLKLKKIVSGPNWPADFEHGFIEASEPSLWLDPLAPTDSEGYKVTVSGDMGFLDSSGKNPNPLPMKVDLADFISNITAYTELRDSKFKGAVKFKDPEGFTQWGMGNTAGCIWMEDGSCGVTREFPGQSKFILKVHLPVGKSSWLIGRMADPTVQVASLSGVAPNGFQVQRITVSALPVMIPLISQDISIQKIPNETQSILFDPKTGLCTNQPYCQHGYVGGNTSSAFPFAFRMYDIFKDLLDQKATLMMPIWSVSSLIFFSQEAASLGSQCRGAGFDGLVTTNASIYEGNPPTWDGSSLNYKVAGVHLDSSGNVFQGSYDLLLSSNYARCLYKFSNAPISATISVSDSAGTQSVATSSFSESNGWVHMAARGFTFSSPTIKVSLQQEKKSEPVPSPSPTPTPSIASTPSSSPAFSASPTSQKPTSITCLKGKLTKKVVGLKPVCPAGYKKK
jgi:hypothetical protein